VRIGWLRNRKFLIFLLVGVVLALLISQLPLQAGLFAIKNWISTLGIWGIPTFIGVYLLVTLLGLPNFLLILAGGMLFGLIVGTICVSVADTLGAIACYGVGRIIFRSRIKKLCHKNPQFQQLDQAVGEKGWKILLLTRLSPVIPSNLLNYSFSCTKVNFWQYIFCSWLGTLPVIILYVYIGSFGFALSQKSMTPQQLTFQIGGLVATIAAAIYTTRLAKKTLASAQTMEVE
jgi:uncharacterized membrane protein YdjX (TVP38/TMEM64 family)